MLNTNPFNKSAERSFPLDQPNLVKMKLTYGDGIFDWELNGKVEINLSNKLAYENTCELLFPVEMSTPDAHIFQGTFVPNEKGIAHTIKRTRVKKIGAPLKKTVEAPAEAFTVEEIVRCRKVTKAPRNAIVENAGIESESIDGGEPCIFIKFSWYE